MQENAIVAPSAPTVAGLEWVHKSRWGWHPCSREHFLKLKELHKYWWMSHRRASEHRRWFLKQPQNRVLRMRTKTPSEGKRMVYAVHSRPWPEPKVFVMKWDELIGAKVVAWRESDDVLYDNKYRHLEGCGRHPGYVLNIPAEFNRARMPAASSSEVKPLFIPESVIDRLLAEARTFYGIASSHPHAKTMHMDRLPIYTIRGADGLFYEPTECNPNCYPIPMKFYDGRKAELDADWLRRRHPENSPYTVLQLSAVPIE